MTRSHRLWAEDMHTLAWLHAEERSACQWLDLEASGFPAGLASVPAHDPASLAMAAALVELRAAVAGKQAGALDDVLAADYAAIYLTYAVRVSPCESVWRDEDHLVLQRSTFEVRALLQRYGLTVPNWRRMPEDHIANELSLLGYLLDHDERQASADFLRGHVMVWLPQFAQQVSGRAATTIYASLAMLTQNACRALQCALGAHLAATQV